MNVTIEWIKENFRKLNELYFNSQLPTPMFRISNARNYYGCFYAYRPRFGMTAREHGKLKGLPYGELVISNRDCRPEKDKLNTLLHEMVHLWQYWNDLPHGHGADFKRKAAELNKHGWAIQRVGGSVAEATFESYNNDIYYNPTVVTTNPRKVAALKRSISILESKTVLTSSQKSLLALRKEELNKMLCTR